MLTVKCTCLECSLLKEHSVGKLLLHPALLFLGPDLGLLLSGGGQQSGHYFLSAQGLPLTLLRHLQPELINHPVMTGPHIPMADHTVW